VIVVGGMDKPDKILSTEYDLAYINEATELTLNDWESLSGRMRNGVMPYQQIMADCNPSTPSHWLYQRVKSGLTTIFYSTHKDNPAYWDEKIEQWTAIGKRYLERLGKLTGIRRARFFEGKWVSAEGVIYTDWDPSIHVIDRFDIPKAWDRYWVIDFGYTHPFVWQAWAQDPDGRLYRYREIYMTQRLVEDHAVKIMEITKGEPEPVEIITDHDAEDRATFERKTGKRTMAAKKDVSPGIQATAERMRLAGDGKPRIFFLRDSLVEVDIELSESGLPTCTEDEMDSYVWDTRTTVKKEQPLKENDHGCDTTRYMVARFDLGHVTPDVTITLHEQQSRWRRM
jgi:phage terminase large subunit